MAKKSHPQPSNPFHPGEMLLEEVLVPAGITQTPLGSQFGRKA
jgi:plasmid maintenance system antidote protein VapI